MSKNKDYLELGAVFDCTQSRPYWVDTKQFDLTWKMDTDSYVSHVDAPPAYTEIFLMQGEPVLWVPCIKVLMNTDGFKIHFIYGEHTARWLMNSNNEILVAVHPEFGIDPMLAPFVKRPTTVGDHTIKVANNFDLDEILSNNGPRLDHADPKLFKRLPCSNVKRTLIFRDVDNFESRPLSELVEVVLG